MNAVGQPIHFNNLHLDVLRIIFFKLRRKEVAYCERVCKLWRHFLTEDRIWIGFAEREGFQIKGVCRIRPEDVFIKRFTGWFKINIGHHPGTVKQALRPLVLASNAELKKIYDPLLAEALGGYEEIRSFPVIQKINQIKLEDLHAPITRGFDGNTHILIFRYRDRRKNKILYEIWNHLPKDRSYIHWAYSFSRHHKVKCNTGDYSLDYSSLIEGNRWKVDEYVLDRLKRLVQRKPVGVPSAFFDKLHEVEILEEVDAIMDDGKSRVVLV